MSETAPLYDPFSYEVHEDPFPVYKRLRDEAPAYFNQQLGFWALSRYADVRQALVDHDRYCSGQGFTLEDIGEFTVARYRVTTGLLVGTIKVSIEVLKLAEKHNRRVSVRLIDEFLFNDL